ncbi:MAG: RluA family pseudouridine synthase [Deltaproteobacteria bacterium]|nr:RluA family pseudouridine synthase [Deltaproteobacteria bacterium]
MEHGFFLHPSWPLLYEDNHLLVLYKPAGLLVQGDETGETSLLELGKGWLKQRYNKPGKVFLGMVHRLDRPVAGVLLFCRTSKAAERLSLQFRTHAVRKTYLAVVEGTLEKDSGHLLHHLERRRGRSSSIVSGPTGQSRDARLSYRVLEHAEGKSLVEIDLETGRHHQIRVQMSHMGCPVLGDLRYGASSPLPDKQIALLASRLNVAHPTRGEELDFRSPIPLGWPWSLDPSPEASAPWNWSELRRLLSPEIPGSTGGMRG